MSERKTRQFILLPLLAFVIPLVAQEPSRFSSSRGFSFEPPPGWLVASKEQTQVLTQEVKTQLNKLGNVNLDRVAVVAFDPAEDEFAETMNVVVSPGRIPLDEQGVEEKLARAIRTQYSEAGVSVSSLKASLHTFGVHKGLLVESQMGMQGVDIRQWQVMIPGGKQSYIVTCTASSDEFDSFQPLFTAAIATMQIDEGLSGVPGWLINALVGGAIGGLFGAAKWLFSDKTKVVEEKPEATRESVSE